MAGCCGSCAQRSGRVHKTRAWKTRVNNLLGYDVWVYKCQECTKIEFAWCPPQVSGTSPNGDVYVPFRLYVPEHPAKDHALDRQHLSPMD